MRSVLRQYGLLMLVILVVVTALAFIRGIVTDRSIYEIEVVRHLDRNVGGSILVYDTMYFELTPVTVIVYTDRQIFNDELGIPLLRSEHFFSYSEVSDDTGECTVHYMSNGAIEVFKYMVREISHCFYMKDLDTS